MGLHCASITVGTKFYNSKTRTQRMQNLTQSIRYMRTSGTRQEMASRDTQWMAITEEILREVHSELYAGHLGYQREFK